MRKTGEYWKVVCRASGCKKEFRNRSLAASHVLDTGHSIEKVLLMKGTRSHSFPGEKNQNAKLDWDTIKLIRQLNKSGMSTYKISRQLKEHGFKGSTQQNVWNVCAHRTWNKN